MPLRLLEAIVPRDRDAEASGVLTHHGAISITRESLSEGQALLRALLEAERIEPVMDELERTFDHEGGFRVLIFQVEATLPRPEASELVPRPPPSASLRWRLSREELYEDLADAAQLSPVFLATVALASVVAAVGLVRDSVAVIIGAMVLAPLLGPTMALALGSVLGDLRLVARAGRVLALGTLLVLALSYVFGAVFQLAPVSEEIASRTLIGLSDLVLALAAGSAGALAVSTGAPAALIGVMVAVALLPPLVSFGLLLGMGQLSAAPGAGLLFVANLIGVVFAGVLTFLVQGIRPRTWWEADRAKRATVAAVASAGLLLAGLVAFIVLVL